MAGFLTLDEADVAGKRVLVRADLNVPMNDGKVTDGTRIARLAPTLTELAAKGARVIVMSHFGRPGGKADPALSLAPIAPELAAALGRIVAFAGDCIGAEARAVVAKLGDGEFALLENLRFHAGEEANDAAFAADLASLGEVYVNDAFATAHRAHASIAAIARLLPAFAGRLMEAELWALNKALGAPERPVAAVIGGAKVSTKLDLLGNLAAKVDTLVIGGAMANTFLFAAGVDIGASLCEREMAPSARAIMEAAKSGGPEIVLPTDAVIAREFKAHAQCQTVAIDKVPADAMILDIGPATVDDLILRLLRWRTLVWNGPLGAFELPPFDAGTTVLARAVAERTGGGGLLSVAGGGDIVAALVQAGVAGDFSYVSTAGGAFLEWLEGKELPGVAALEMVG
ncbi:MAG: phosphoglycerate kinase [Proteobacteria bacterium]|nr:phosphoglycerate kinase [Pseudomonadota bacterium]